MQGISKIINGENRWNFVTLLDKQFVFPHSRFPSDIEKTEGINGDGSQNQAANHKL